MFKKLIKNTGFLYIRMFITIFIAFFTSRILLKELGINDFGTYKVVGGIVAMFASLKGLLASSTQRFLNYEMGSNNIDRLKMIFSMSITIHIFICILFFVIAELVGLWLLNNILVIDADRINAAHWVLQFSILSMLVVIMTIPYDAVIIANERMDVFAYISILDAVLKLGIIFLISWLDFDKLKLYAILVFIVFICIRSVNAIYCKKNFQECKYQLFWDTKLFKQLGSFAGWNFLGNTTFSLVHEGLNLLLNIFGGPAVNAARGIAYQVRSAVTSFTGNIYVATNPQIVKLYAQNKKEELFKILYTSSKLAFFLLLIICCPIIMYTDFFLGIWLIDVPDYTKSFVQLLLIFLLIRVFHGYLDSLFKASGKIIKYQIMDSSILILSVPFSYILLKAGMQFNIVFIVMIVIEFINFIALLFLSRQICQLNVILYFKKVILPCIYVTIMPVIYMYLSNSLNSSYHESDHIIIYSIGFTLINIACIWFVGLTKSEKHYCKNLALSYKKRYIQNHIKTKQKK
jgi:hypothetical protein